MSKLSVPHHITFYSDFLDENIVAEAKLQYHTICVAGKCINQLVNIQYVGKLELPEFGDINWKKFMESQTFMIPGIDRKYIEWNSFEGYGIVKFIVEDYTHWENSLVEIKISKWLKKQPFKEILETF